MMEAQHSTLFANLNIDAPRTQMKDLQAKYMNDAIECLKRIDTQNKLAVGETTAELCERIVVLRDDFDGFMLSQTFQIKSGVLLRKGDVLYILRELRKYAFHFEELTEKIIESQKPKQKKLKLKIVGEPL